MDAKNGARKSLSGADDQRTESPPSLIDVIAKLVFVMDQQNSLLMELVNQNAVLIESLMGSEEPDDEGALDIAGNRILVT